MTTVPLGLLAALAFAPHAPRGSEDAEIAACAGLDSSTHYALHAFEVCVPNAIGKGISRDVESEEYAFGSGNQLSIRVLRKYLGQKDFLLDVASLPRAGKRVAFVLDASDPSTAAVIYADERLSKSAFASIVATFGFINHVKNLTFIAECDAEGRAHRLFEETGMGVTRERRKGDLVSRDFGRIASHDCKFVHIREYIEEGEHRWTSFLSHVAVRRVRRVRAD